VLTAYVIALMMEAASTSETSINFYQTTRRNNPEERYFLCQISQESLTVQKSVYDARGK
jgi:hypothetical protein